MIEASSTAKNTFNPIRNIVDKIKVDPNPEKKLISLSLGDPTVFGNFSTAKEVKDAMIRALEGGKADGYAPSVGSETARIAIVDRYKKRFNVNFRVENLFITSGCSGALDLAISVICGPGDALLIPQPGFTLYGTLAGSKGINTVNYGLDENKNWEIKLEEVEEAIRGDERIKAWIINNPSNPCGSVYSREHLLSCLKVAKKYGVVVIADEIYEDMVFDGNEYIPIARLSQESKELALPILTCSGLAKRFLVPGWRFGWVAVNEADGFDISGIKKGLFDLSTLIIGSCTLIQSALPDIFANTPESFYEDTNKVLEGNARFLSESLSKIEGLKVIKPQGTMYMLVGIDFERFGSEIDDDLKISEFLISEQSISVLPGSVPHVSAELQWECVRKFNCFVVKRDGAVFSTERGNLMNKHSFKYSGLVHSRSVRVESAGVSGVTVSRRRTKAGSKVATAFSRPALVKASTGIKAVKAKIGGDLEKSFYRRDLIAAAQKRAAMIIKAERFTKKN